ncbi:MAG: alpha-amylase family glycosyl hydrolase [Acidobacteriota bacterium]|nr:alpha-amylase family glycosyl hydrolase [Acidobacteriota bacterium]
MHPNITSNSKLCWLITVILSVISVHTVEVKSSRQQVSIVNQGRVYRDIYLREQSGRLVFGNSKLTLEVGAARGQWMSLVADGIPGSLISPTGAAIDFRVDGVWMVERHGATLLRHEIGVDRMRNGVSLRLIFGVSAQTNQTPSTERSPVHEFELTCSYTLFPGEGRLDRSAKLGRNAGGNAVSSARRLEGFLFQLPGAVIADASECVVDVPGPFFPKTFVKPQTPYDSLKNSSINFHSAPDAGFGLLAVSNEQRNATLASWMDTAGEVAYRSALHGDGRRISLRHHNLREYRMTERFAVDSDVHRVEFVNGPLPAALAKYRQMVELRMPINKQTPAWANEMVLLEVYPSYYPGGFKGLTKRLPFYREVGFNTIYIMPHWVGGYSPIDLFKVEPSLGTAADLKEAVRTAHALGMKVLFDMVIHGFNEKSPVVRERPDIFVRTEQNELARHPTWKSVTTDWASPAYQQYMDDLVRHDLKEYDIDGYRVDAATFKGASWDPALPYPAYRSGSAAPELMRRMLKALSETKPDAVLLSEVFGPVFYTVSNLVHDNQTEAPQLLLEKMEAHEVTAADYKLHIANVLDALPAGANRVFYARNHDTSWFYHFNGYTPRFMALEAVHAFFGIPEVFAGDPEPKNGPSPDADPAVYDYYRKLFALRKEFPELAGGEVLLREAVCDNASVFVGLRRMNNRLTLVMVSLSGREETGSVTLRPEASAASGIKRSAADIELRDAISGEVVRVLKAGGESANINFKMKPFQVLVGRV